jgi:hypothetical protein
MKGQNYLTERRYLQWKSWPYSPHSLRRRRTAVNQFAFTAHPKGSLHPSATTPPPCQLRLSLLPTPSGCEGRLLPLSVTENKSSLLFLFLEVGNQIQSFTSLSSLSRICLIFNKYRIKSGLG